MANTTASHVADVEKCRFFVLRSPLKPFAELVRWGAELQTCRLAHDGADRAALESAWLADLQLLRTRLARIVEQPEVRQALFIASPSLDTGIQHWLDNPVSAKGRKAERALVRYVERMCSRATPFGIFSGCSLGDVDSGGDTAFLLAAANSYRTSSRLDFDYLFTVADTLCRDEALVGEMRYWPNPTLRIVGSRWHYVESRTAGTARSHHLVRLDSDRYLDFAIAQAEGGASLGELTEALMALDRDDGLTADDCHSYVKELVINGVVVSTLSPNVTGAPAITDLIRQLDTLPSGSQAATRLRGIEERLAVLDREALGTAPDEYRTIAEATSEALPTTSQPAHLLQVDMFKPAQHVALGGAVLEEILTGADMLVRLRSTPESDDLLGFKDDFTERYGQVWMPLTQVMDEEVGIGFGGPPRTRQPHAGVPDTRSPALRAFHGLLLRKLIEHGASDAREVELTPDDLPRASTIAGWPSAFDVIATVAARSAAACQAGDFHVHVRAAHGPSGATLLGRFCHTDPELEQRIREHLRDEEALHPDVTFAEVVFLPEGRVGNVLCRPVLRDYELVVLGRSGAPRSQQLPLSDLLVTVDESGNILLYSHKLERIVVPRLTNAHGFRNPRLPAAYRFLTALQAQTGGHFSWGPASSARVLPRVRIGRVILSPAQWQLTKAETSTLSGGLDGFINMQAIRREKGLPQWVVLAQGDNLLPVDLDNPLSVDAFMHVIKGSDGTILTELYPPPDELVATGPEGAYVHEIVLPCVRKTLSDGAAATSTARAIARAKLGGLPAERLFPPGSDWVYIKLYGGRSALEEFIAAELPDTIREAQERQLIDGWFYLRYRDPHDHLRVRCHCRDTDNIGTVLRIFHERSSHLLMSGLLWKIDVDTYQRELERYKGVEGTQASEQIFEADSHAAATILRALHAAGADESPDGKRIRQQLCVLGVHRLLLDCGLSMADRHALVRRLHEAMWSHQQGSPKQQLADRFREQRRALESLLWGQVHSNRLLAAARAAYDERSARIAPIIRQLKALPSVQALPELLDLASSYVHLHVNRLFPVPARTTEGLIYDLLWKLYESEAAREKAVDRVRMGSGAPVTAASIPRGSV